jgi:hypothetical protein
MTLVGSWNLYWSWGATNGVFPSTEITFNADGTFTVPQFDYTGKWTEVDGTVMWQFDPPDPRPIYAGIRTGTAINGLMRAWELGATGTFYAIRGALASPDAESEATGYDPAARPLQGRS